MDNEHSIKIYCPNIGKEGYIRPSDIKHNTCPFCGCTIDKKKKEIYICNLQISPTSA